MNQPIDIKKLTLPQLRDAIAQAEQWKVDVAARLSALQNELCERVSSEARQLFAAAGKQAGDVTFTTADGVKLKASISKTVKWDNAQLQAIASSMDWAMAQRVFDISFKVPESTFKAIPDPKLVAKLEAARTVKYGDLTIKPVFDKD